MEKREEICVALIQKWYPEIRDPQRCYEAVRSIVRTSNSWDWEKDLICCRAYWDDRDAEAGTKSGRWMTRLVNWARKHPEFRKETVNHEPSKEIAGLQPQFDKDGKLLGYKKLQK